MSWDQSRTARVLQAVKKRVARASDGSVVAKRATSLATRIETLVRSSYCYRWLTAEPDPEVIVIDLRETHTVGPVVRLLKRIIDPADRAWANSGLAPVASVVGAALSRSRTGRALTALLEPPESPEENNEDAD